MELIKTDLVDVNEGMKRLTAYVKYNDGIVDEYWYEYPSHFEISNSGNPWLAALLPMAATIGEDLIIPLPLDPRLVDGAKDILRFWKAHEVGTSIVSIIPTGEIAVLEKHPEGSASFFSSGLDAFFTAYNKPRIQYQILVHGFDLSINKEKEFKAHFERISKISKKMGKELIPVKTNIRQTRWKQTRWQAVSHGASLASIGLLFENYFHEIFIPSSTKSFLELSCWGSHPLTDPLFSTSRTSILTDGDGFTRLEKIQAIKSHQLALDHLHVCIRGRDGSGQDEINCSHCEKCYRTMIALELSGVLEKCKLFDLNKYNHEEIHKIYISKGHTRNYEFFIEIAQEQNRPDLVKHFRGAIRRSKIIWILELLENIPFLWRIPHKLKEDSIY